MYFSFGIEYRIRKLIVGHSDPADLFGGKTPDKAFWNAQIHATSANTDHLWERVISALVFLYTGGV